MESTAPPLVGLLSLDKDVKLPDVLQFEELKSCQHMGTVEQYYCQKLHNNCCFPLNMCILLLMNLSVSGHEDA